MSAKRGMLFVCSGPSGVGKGTLNGMLVKEFAGELALSVSATTRGPRSDEREGINYFYISREAFERHIAHDDFLEYTEYSGEMYGTLRPFVEDLRSRGIHVMLEIEVEGAMQVMRRVPECVTVFVLPPSFAELERRLRARGTETEDKIRRRMEKAKIEVGFAGRYDYQIVNDDIEDAYAKLRGIYLSGTHRESESALAK